MGWWASHQNIGWMDWVIRYPLDYYNYLSTCVAKKKVLWKRKISRCGFCPFFTFEIIQYMLSANLVLWIFSSLCSDKDCHTWQHEMMARWEQLEEPFHPNFSNWSFAFLDFYKVWKWHILLLCTKGLTLEQALGSRGYRSLLIGWFLLRLSDFSLVGNITDHGRISYQIKRWNSGLSLNYDLVLISLN